MFSILLRNKYGHKLKCCQGWSTEGWVSGRQELGKQAVEMPRPADYFKPCLAQKVAYFLLSCLPYGRKLIGTLASLSSWAGMPLKKRCLWGTMGFRCFRKLSWWTGAGEDSTGKLLRTDKRGSDINKVFFSFIDGHEEVGTELLTKERASHSM